MSDYERFQEDINGSEELQKKYEEALKAAAAAGAASDCEAIINAVKAFGYNITESDVEKSYAEMQELSEDDLSQITGGFRVDEYGHEVICFFAWHCFAAILHTEATTTQAACWKDHTCVIVNAPDKWDFDETSGDGPNLYD